MAETVKINGEVNGLTRTDFFAGFGGKVHRDWIKSRNPEKIVTCKKPEDVKISSGVGLHMRITSKCVVFNWNITVLTQGKQLQYVALTLNENRKNIVIQSVYKDNIEIGMTNGDEWYNPHVQIETSDKNGDKNTRYCVQISFFANEFGTYRQNIIFYFGEYPAILERICVDCLPNKDFIRIQKATDYQLSQNPKRWVDKVAQTRKFESPFVPPKDPREFELAAIYPYPEKDNFFLTQETLTDDRLTPSNYRGRLHELISVEELARHEQIARYDGISYMRLLSQYILVSTGDGSTISKYAPLGELFAQLTLNRSISEDTKSGRLFLRGCNRILFKKLSNNVEESVIFEAHIEDKCTQSVYVRLSKHCVDTLNLVADTFLRVQVQFVLSRLPFCEWHRAVDSLPDIGLVFINEKQKHITDRNQIDIFTLNAHAFGDHWNCLISNALLNTEQKRALIVMTSPQKIPLPPILLFGPFGTGKTFTIAQALYILLTQNAETKILLCTHSNSAADLYVKEFFDVWYKMQKQQSLKPIRIYYKGRARNTVHPVVQEYCLMDEDGSFRDPNEEDLKNCSLIVTTLATSSSLTRLNLSPTHIVIDEAAQALECEVLIPLALATRETRLILAGDQMQLVPEIYSDLASERGLGISLLERIYEMYPQEHLCRIQLCKNYRAHEDIIKFTSEIFYGGMVKPGNKLLMRHPVLKPLTFYAVQGDEIQGTDSTGYAHGTEAYELANRVLQLKNSWPEDCWGPYGEGSIGVLSYYAEQVQRIRTELRKHKLFDVSVERVLNVQGKQFTAVFISTVRTVNCCRYSAERNIKDYGFLTNPRLLNTAMTRAKCLVAVVGDPVALLSIGSCKKLWQKYLELADLQGIKRETLAYHLSLVPELPLATQLNPLAEEFVPRNQQSSCIIEYVPSLTMHPISHYPVT